MVSPVLTGHALYIMIYFSFMYSQQVCVLCDPVSLSLQGLCSSFQVYFLLAGKKYQVPIFNTWVGCIEPGRRLSARNFRLRLLFTFAYITYDLITAFIKTFRVAQGAMGPDCTCARRTYQKSLGDTTT